MKKVDWKNVFERALWTFIEGFLAGIPAITVITPYLDGDVSALKKFLIITLVGCVASGISAVKTILLDVIEQLKTEEK